MADRIPVLFDTDIGADIDDALALSYLLAEPDCELAGITTVSGDTRKRAAMAAWLCGEAGRPETPVFAGLEGPLLDGTSQPDVSQFAAVPPGFPLPQNEPWEAICFLREKIRERPGEVVLLGVGPMTNLGALFLIDHEIPSLLRGLYLMCGTFGVNEAGRRNKNEWNTFLDPAASAALYKCAAPGQLITLGLDVTLQCGMPRREFEERMAAARGAGAAALRMLEHWKGETVYLHDPLAAASIFQPELCVLERGTASVAYGPGEGFGRTFWESDPDGPHRVGSRVDASRFFESFFDRVCTSSAGG